MEGQINPKIVGSAIIGFALVAGAYTLSNFGEPRRTLQTADVYSAISTARVSIDVTDNDNNGIEDWRDEFVTTKAISLDTGEVDYTPPDTLTGQMSVGFMEGFIRSRENGPFGSSNEEIIDNTIDVMSRITTQKLYDVPDITIMQGWSDQDIVNYANTLANVIRRHNIPELESELEILHDVVTNENEERLTELRSLAQVYSNYRDDTLKIPVPGFLVKQHLDLINTYEAIYTDIISMTQVLDDPATTLLRIKRYQDDASGLAYALQNMYLAVEPYANLFTEEDPAVLFVIFSPNYQN